MVAGSAALAQECERSFFGLGPGLSSKCSAGPGRATCISCVEVLCGAVLHTRLHELQLSAYNCTFCYIGSGFYTDAQTLRQRQVVRMALQSCSLITPARSSVCCKGISVFQCPLGMRQ